MATLQDVVQSARFAQLREAGLWERIAAVLNAPEEITSDNPVAEAPLVFRGAPTVADLAAVLTDAEVVAFARDDLKVTSLADTAGTPEAVAAAAAITRWVQAAGVYDASVWQVAKAALEYNRPNIAQTLFGLIVMAGMMPAERAAELAAALLMPDLTWSATVSTWGDSESDAQGWGFVDVQSVKDAGTAA